MSLLTIRNLVWEVVNTAGLHGGVFRQGLVKPTDSREPVDRQRYNLATLPELVTCSAIMLRRHLSSLGLAPSMLLATHSRLLWVSSRTFHRHINHLLISASCRWITGCHDTGRCLRIGILRLYLVYIVTLAISVMSSSFLSCYDLGLYCLSVPIIITSRHSQPIAQRSPAITESDNRNLSSQICSSKSSWVNLVTFFAGLFARWAALGVIDT